MNAAAAADSNAPVLFSERPAGNGHVVACAQLNAPKALNALSGEMINALLPQLADWGRRDDVACVVLHGSGEKAFCAGGDLMALYRAMREADGAPCARAETFFADEYRLDYTIHTFPKPILCWGTGTVMGGGLGIMAGASHRVVTETTVIAMPEVGIGLFPDVAAGWFLNRMPGRTGLFLALTGSPVNATDAWLVGLAEAYVDSNQREAVLDALTTVPWQGDARTDASLLSRLLRTFEQQAAEPPASRLLAHRATIAQVTDAADVAGLLAALEAVQDDDPWLQRAAASMARAAPMSMAVAFEQWHTGGHLSLADTFRREFAMAVQFTRHADFAEGIRALLVDKDRQPAWSPADSGRVNQDDVRQRFQLPSDYGRHPLADLE